MRFLSKGLFWTPVFMALALVFSVSGSFAADRVPEAEHATILSSPTPEDSGSRAGRDVPSSDQTGKKKSAEVHELSSAGGKTAGIG